MVAESALRFLPRGGRRVAYEVRGNGPPLIAPAWWVSHLELDWQSDPPRYVGRFSYLSASSV